MTLMSMHCRVISRFPLLLEFADNCWYARRDEADNCWTEMGNDATGVSRNDPAKASFEVRLVMLVMYI